MALSPSMRSLRNRYLFFTDAALLAIAPFLAYAIRFEGWGWTATDRATAITFAEFAVPLSIIVCWAFGLYRRLWRYASIAELELIFAAAATADVLIILLRVWIMPSSGLTAGRVPLSVLFAVSLLTFAILGAPRLLMRIAGWRSLTRKSTKGDRRVLIAGAGTAGESIVRELRANPELQMDPVGFVDDDLQKHGMRLSSLPVLGALNTIPSLVR